MLRFGSFRFRKEKTVEDIHYVCQVRFLDDSEPLSITYQKDTKGQYLLDHVCKTLDVVETDYFGLRFVNASKQVTWIDASRSIHRQLKGLSAPVLSFRVKYYPSDLTKLREEITRYQIYLQLKKDFFHGRLHCSEEDTSLLAAYIIQSELGDFDPDEHLSNYVSEVKCLPPKTDLNEHAISNVHKTLVGKVPADVEGLFLKKASELDTYGVVPHPVVDLKGNSLYLGITHRGVLTFYNNSSCTHVFKWTQIRRFDFDGKMFIVRLTNFDSDDSSLLLKKTLRPPESCGCGRGKKPACGFRCPTLSDCRLLWQTAIEQHYFFTLHSAVEAPSVSSGGLFHRSSKFRFSGRCEKEAFTSSMDIRRKEPSFVRSLSNAQFSEKYNSLRSATLPSQWRPHGPDSAKDEDQTDAQPVTEANLNDSFQSSCGAMKDEVVSSVIVEEELVIAETDDAVANKLVTCADVMQENMPSSEGEEGSEAEVDEPSLASSKAASPTKMQDTFEWSNEMAAAEFPPVTFTTQSEPNIHAKEFQPVSTLSVTHEAEDIPEDSDNEESGPMNGGEVSYSEPGFSAVEKNPESSSKVAWYRHHRMRTFFRVISATLVLIVVLLMLVFETSVDLPVINDLRDMPEVQEYANIYYRPVRQTFIDQYYQLMG